jgi:hypothetical protein
VELAKAGISGALIQQAAGWTSEEMLQRYIAAMDAETGLVAGYLNTKRR